MSEPTTPARPDGRWPHTSALVHEAARTSEDSWYSLLQTRTAGADLLPLVEQLAYGDALETLWDGWFAPTHPAAFTTVAGRLVLRTPGPEGRE